MNYKKLASIILSVSVILVSAVLVYSKVIKADAAIIDCTTVPGNLIQNCSFEDADPLTPGYTASAGSGYPAVFAGYTGLTDWSIITPETGNVVIVTGATGNAPEGDRVIDVSGVIDPPETTGLNGEIFGSGIEQTVNGLVIGQTYTLKFYQSHLTDTNNTFPSQVNVFVNGVSKGVFSHDENSVGDTIGLFTWTENTLSFTATTTSAVIGFYNNSPTPDLLDGLNRPVAVIDNIILTQDVDDTSPSVVLSTAAISPVSGLFSVTITFSEQITGLTLGDFSLINGVASNLSAPTDNIDGTQTYTVDITPNLDGDYTQINLPATTVIDTSSNPNTASNTLSVLYDVTSPIISSVHIESDNANQNYATTGDVVTLNYTLDDLSPIEKQTVTIGGSVVTPSCVASVTVIGGQDCTANLTVPSGVPVVEGLLTFSIVVETNAGQTMTATTDGSYVVIDRTIRVRITSPNVNDDLSSFVISGQCEVGAGNVTISGTGFTPNPISVPCNASDGPFGYFQYNPVIGTPGTITIIATQTDIAGNVGTDTETYSLGGPGLPIVTITGPVGVTPTGTNTLTGSCTTDAGSVTISGTGFTIYPSGTLPITVACVLGSYSLPITITGNTSITVSQTNDVGTAGVTVTTTLPTSTSSGGGGWGGGGGCLPGYPCDITYSGISTVNQSGINTSNNPQINTATIFTCPVFTQYLKQGMRDGKNGISEVSRVQNFLNKRLQFSLQEDGVFGSQTKEAVKNFQSLYFKEILEPWMLSGPTGFWYQSTRSFANYLENCSEGVVQLNNSVLILDGKIIRN